MAKFIKAPAPVSFDLIGFRVDVPVVAMLSIFLSIKLLFFAPSARKALCQLIYTL